MAHFTYKYRKNIINKVCFNRQEKVSDPDSNHTWVKSSRKIKLIRVFSLNRKPTLQKKTAPYPTFFSFFGSIRIWNSGNWKNIVCTYLYFWLFHYFFPTCDSAGAGATLAFDDSTTLQMSCFTGKKEYHFQPAYLSHPPARRYDPFILCLRGMTGWKSLRAERGLREGLGLGK